MPHLILEYSENVIEKNNLRSLLKNFHAILKNGLPTELHSCKSRAIEHNVFYVGSGKHSNAFIHLTLKVMPGRSPDILKKIGNTIMEQLENYFAESLKHLNLQISLEIIELQSTYFKIVSSNSH